MTRNDPVTCTDPVTDGTGSRLLACDRPVREVPRVLSIAGTDPSGGAGIQADLKSIAAAGGYGMAVVTSLVAQNTEGVRAVHTPDRTFLRAQLDAVSDDVTIDAVKIGMLGDAGTVAEVADWLASVRVPLVVLDPVMIATSGDRLLPADAEHALRELVARADLVTPNIPELAVLAREDPASDVATAVDQARRFAEEAGTAVLVKTGHLTGADAGNTLVTADGAVASARSPRLESTSTHGTGCSLSSALTTRLARDHDPARALTWATDWLHEAIRHGEALEVGQGHGPVDHFHRWRRAP